MWAVAAPLTETKALPNSILEDRCRWQHKKGRRGGGSKKKCYNNLPHFPTFSGTKKAYTAPPQCGTFLCPKKWGPQRKDFGGRYGFHGFYRVFVSTTCLESFSLRPEKFSKRFSFGGRRVCFFLLWFCDISWEFPSLTSSAIKHRRALRGQLFPWWDSCGCLSVGWGHGVLVVRGPGVFLTMHDLSSRNFRASFFP